MPSTEERRRGCRAANCEIPPGLRERVPVDARLGRRGRRERNAAARELARHRERSQRRRQTRAAPPDGDQTAAGERAEQDREEGPRLDQRVAADQLALVEVLRQDRVLDRAEERRCMPMRKSAASSSARLRSRKPTAPTTMIAISSSLTQADEARLSYLSASCPAVAEKRKNGRMKMPPQIHQMPASTSTTRRLEGDEQDQRVLEEVVVEGAEKLGQEERREAALRSSSNWLCPLMVGRRRIMPALARVGVAALAGRFAESPGRSVRFPEPSKSPAAAKQVRPTARGRSRQGRFASRSPSPIRQ